MKRIVFLFFVLAGISVSDSMAQTAVKEPFFTSIIKKSSNGSVLKSIKTPDGTVFPMINEKELKVLFYLNGKSYTEQEVMQLDPAAYKAQPFYFTFPWYHQIEGRDMKEYMMLLFTGSAPPLSDYTLKQRALEKKYKDKTITGVVKGLNYAANKVLTGFTLESGTEEYIVYINTNEVSRLMKTVVAGDIIIIEVGHVSISKDSTVPGIFPKTLTKDGEKLMLNGTVQI